jgi:hypothetical protein
MIAAVLGMIRRPMRADERARYVETAVSMICDNLPPPPAQTAATSRAKPAKKKPSS